MEKEINHFLKKNRSKSAVLWIREDMKISCLRKRKIINAIEFLEKSLNFEKNDDVSDDKGKSTIGIPNGLINDLDKGFKIYTIDHSKLKDKNTERLIYDFLFNDMMLFESSRV